MPVSKPNGSDQRTKAKEVWRRATAVCFDVDSTLIQEEGIDKLADYCGAGEQVAEWYLNFVYGIASSSCWTASPTSLARSSWAAPGRRSCMLRARGQRLRAYARMHAYHMTRVTFLVAFWYIGLGIRARPAKVGYE